MSRFRRERRSPAAGLGQPRPRCVRQTRLFDITRSPNHHIAFSKGAHFCLGANLARMETRIAITNLVTRFPDLRLAVDPAELTFAPVPFWRRLTALPVALR